MGLMKRAKVGAITSDAQKAWDAGNAVFVARFWDEVIAFQGTGSVGGAAEAIEQVEAVGWRLAHVAYAWVPEKKRGVQVLVFRRPGA